MTWGSRPSGSASCRLRRGTTLILFAILLFVFFAFAGLIIDIGFARVSTCRMNTVADSTALEGVRWRDQFPDTIPDTNAFVVAAGGNPVNAADVAAARDLARRQQASAVARIAFSDHDIYQERDEQFGAGPIIGRELGTLSTDTVNAGERLLPNTLGVYKPRLQTNHILNLDGGDLVAGTYFDGGNISHVEGSINGQFDRQDFTVAIGAAAPEASAFLVRMRQSRDDVIDGVSSTGPTIPYLFARGSLIPGSESPSGYAPRRDGITVRSTAIADARPAVYAGVPIAGSNVLGVGRIAILREFWETGLPAVDANGRATPVAVNVSGTSLTTNAGSAGMLLSADALTIGAVPVAGIPSLPATFRGYVPIIQELTPGTFRVIGFGWAEVSISGANGTVTKLCKDGGAVGPRNASADLRMAWPTLGPPILSDTDRGLVRSANASLRDPLLSPVLVRSVGD